MVVSLTVHVFVSLLVCMQHVAESSRTETHGTFASTVCVPCVLSKRFEQIM